MTNSITNSKVLSLQPAWAPFPGFSLLFDNPGDSLRRHGNLEQVACRLDREPSLVLYKSLSETLARLGIEDLRARFGLCLLPTASYHVTAYDCGNAGNVDRAVPSCRASLDRLLKSLPDGWTEDHELVRPGVTSEVAKSNWAPIRFRFDRLVNWDNQVVVARLKPADTDAEQSLATFVAQRAQLSDLYQSTFGFGAGPRFTPHVSLAYFASEGGGALASALLDEWDRKIRRECEHLEICFDSVHVYGFTDMATFFRCP